MALTERDKKFAEMTGIPEEVVELYSCMYDREKAYVRLIASVSIAAITILIVLITKLSGLW